MDNVDKLNILISRLEKFFLCKFIHEEECEYCINCSQISDINGDNCSIPVNFRAIFSDIEERIKEICNEQNQLIEERDNALAALRRKITDEKIAALQMAIELDMNKQLKGGNNNEGM